MIYKFLKIESTNKYAIENIDKMRHLDVIVSEEQTNGYGVSGKWESIKGNLFFTMIIEEEYLIDEQIAFRILVSINDLLKKHVKGTYIKLPNDIFHSKKKISGFIIERKKSKLILGIGINVFHSNEKFINMYEVNKKEYDIMKLAKELSLIIEKNLIIDQKKILSKFKEYSYLIGEKILYKDKKNKQSKSALCTDIDYTYIYFEDDKILLSRFIDLSK